jgi:hypothetical protein
MSDKTNEQGQPEAPLAKVVNVLGRIAEQLPRLIGDLEELRAAAQEAAQEAAQPKSVGPK